MPTFQKSIGYLPRRVVDNAEWSRFCSLGSELDLGRMGGVETRRIWDPSGSMPLHRLSAQAARHGAWPPPSLVLHATTTPDATSPATAHRLHAELGLPTGVAACDVTSSCTSVLSALLLAKGDALVVAAEAKSRHIAPGDGRAAALFGDGAVALRLQGIAPDPAVWLEPFVDSSLVDNIRVQADPSSGLKQQLVLSQGKLMFRRTVAALVAMIERALVVCRKSEWELARVFIHQANSNVLAEVKRHFPDVFIPVLMSDIGNTVSVSLPLHRLRVLTLVALAGHDPGCRDAAAAPARRTLLERLGEDCVFRACDGQEDDASYGLVCRYGDEKLMVLDGSVAAGAGASRIAWLEQVSEHEWSAFFSEAEAAATRQKAAGAPVVHAEAWIGAGGGFQALGFVQPMLTRAGEPGLLGAAAWH